LRARPSGIERSLVETLSSFAKLLGRLPESQVDEELIGVIGDGVAHLLLLEPGRSVTVELSKAGDLPPHVEGVPGHPPPAPAPRAASRPSASVKCSAGFRSDSSISSGRLRAAASSPMSANRRGVGGSSTRSTTRRFG